MPESITIDGFGPLPVHRPESVAALCDLVKQQRAKREAIYPVGGRTMLDFGLPPTKPGIALDMTAFNRVIDYPARDMTITVQAGITFRDLQVTLAKENQWLPLDVPDPELMTIGGLIACNVSGPRRLGYGTLRDYLIGISFINDDGVEIKGGGRVVKNVAGYDLMKLHIGALGTMGVITQVTLKVRPRPESQVTAIVHLDSFSLDKLVSTLQESKTRPVAVSVHRSNPYSVFVHFEEKRKTVEWQLHTLRAEYKEASIDNIIFENTSETNKSGWSAKNATYLVNVSLSSSLVSNYLTRLLDGRENYFQSEALCGVVAVTSFEQIEIPETGTVRYLRCPREWKTSERVFGKPTPAFELMRHIQRTLDPDGVFNPGRMF